MYEKIQKSGVAQTSTPTTTRKMEETSSRICKGRMPKQIVLSASLEEGDQGFVWNDADGLFEDFNISQNLATMLSVAGKLTSPTLRRVLQSFVPVISLINYKSTLVDQLNNGVLFKAIQINGTVWREDLFEVATAERNTQFVDNLQTIKLRPAENVPLFCQTGIVIAAETPPVGQTNEVTIAMEVDRWLPYNEAMKML